MSFPASTLRLGALAGLGLFLVAGTPAYAHECLGAQQSKAKAQGYTISAANQEDGSILVTYELLGEPQLFTAVKQGQIFSHFNIKGLTTGGDKGLPELLTKQANLMVDANTEYSVELVDSSFKSFDLVYPYLPSRGVIYRNQDPTKIPYTVEPTRGAYPANVIEEAEPFFIRNVSGYALRFNVNQVDGNQAKLYTKLVFKVTPQGSRAEFRGMEDRAVTEEVYGPVKSMFLNVNADMRASWPYELGEKGELLVIHTSRDAAAIKPFVDYKKSKGFTVTTQEVAKGTNVKSTIQQAYNANKNLLYVQLVGDWADIKCDTMITTPSGGAPETAAMDNALALVSGADKYFDLIIGRFSAESAAEVTTQVNKAIAYEQAGKASWKTRAHGMASNEPQGGDDGERDPQHEDLIKNKKLLPNGFTSVTSAYDKSGGLAVSTTLNPVNAGLGLINYTGHGTHTGWQTPGVYNQDLNSLNNGSMTPIIFSVACVVGQYNSTTKTSFAETWLRKTNGGAVAAAMSTTYQPWTPPMVAQDYMNDLLVGGYNYDNGGSGTDTDHGKNTLGSIVFNAFNLTLGESKTTSTVDCLNTWVLFGDCTLNVSNQSPLPGELGIVGQPSSQTVREGGTATFTVQVSGGSGPYTYQWYKNGSTIPGATFPSYSFKPVITDNKATFHVVVKDSAYKSVQSEIATLTVEPPVPEPTDELIVNGGFEGGSNGWSSEDISKVVGSWSQQKAFAGSAYAWLCGYGKTTKQHLYQGVNIPSDVASAKLSFQLHIDTAETTKSTQYDTLKLYVVNAQGSVLGTLAAFSNLDARTGFVQKGYDLSNYKGQNVYVYFLAQEDTTSQTSFVIDNVSLIAR